MSAIKEFYNFVIFDLADPRVEDWPLMSSYLKPLAIVVGYLYVVYNILPRYMNERKAYNLKHTIAIYNIFQIISCSILIWGVATSGWTTHYTLGCELGSFSRDPMAMRLSGFVWWTMMLKMLELVETAFFILRKKYGQVTFLHVYHHASTFVLGWLGVKYYATGMLTFNIILNSFIHILMYTYYFLSGLGPEMQKKVESFKPKMTAMQMIQLCMLFLHTAQILLPSCKIHNVVAYIYLPNIMINILFFINFYKRKYFKKDD